MNTMTENKAKTILAQENSWLQEWKKKLQQKISYYLIEKGVLLWVIGFLLGRAVIMDTLSPFVMAFVASIWFLRKDKTLGVIISSIAGALTFPISHSGSIMLALLLFLCICMFVHQLPQLEKILPFIVAISASVAKLAVFAMTVQITYIEWLIAGVEGILASILFLIFMQSIPLLSPKRYKPALKNEEIICFIILIASILTGLVGIQFYDAQTEQVFARYFVLILSYIGGAAIGSTVGVVAGLILSLANLTNIYQMSLLAFSGLLGGLLKEGKKLTVSLGLVIGTLLISLYASDIMQMTHALIESGLAILLFLVTPDKWIRNVARYIPGTVEHSREQEQYLKKVRDVTAHQVERFSNVFQALSKSFQIDSNAIDEQDIERDYYLSNVTEKSCQTCFLKEACWVKQFDTTYELMGEVKDELEANGKLNHILQRKFENHCIQSSKVIDVMKQELSFFQANQQLKKQVLESRLFVADQLKGVSDVMNNFAKEIVKEKENHEQQEIEIIAALRHVGIELEKLDIYSLEQGNIDIEMVIPFVQYHGEAEKLIAPILSDILSESIEVVTTEISPVARGSSYFAFGSARKYTVSLGVAHAAKGGGLVSGDSYKAMELGAGKFALAISDGMGNGKRAYQESNETLRLLQQILESGLNEHVAIKSINSILSLRTKEEIYATLDLAMIDLHEASVKFLKVGSTPSFIMRNNFVEKVEASNLPIGIIQEFDVEVVNAQLQEGDILVMMSDGIFEGPKHIGNIDMWLKRKMVEIQSTNPQEIADLLLEEVIRSQSGEIEDDMTVLVAQVKENKPDWAPIPAYRTYGESEIS
ncbi:stage II sporulation protein E [Gracilibacillus halotolerans]|uniref:Stage II sporulation protein E n=1 Tax=Gracilibacillus halotolerans TaxID=74386 RepID=A0A841RSQ9_9BACI|nr:stage II sporulation protein E [Gracilibacillus halotolerans]MBB6513974.1 stage II sporulation protein E [Gracilibacillus halotolerans]